VPKYAQRANPTRDNKKGRLKCDLDPISINVQPIKEN
jgi:hypothetical protein